MKIRLPPRGKCTVKNLLNWRLSALGAPGLVRGFRRRIRWIEAERRLPFAHPLDHEGLEQVLFGSLVGDFLGNVRWNDNHAFAIADHDIARKNRDAATTDWHVEVGCMVLDQVGRRRAALAVSREG